MHLSSAAGKKSRNRFEGSPGADQKHLLMNSWLSNERKETLSTFYKAFLLVARFVHLIFSCVRDLIRTRVFAKVTKISSLYIVFPQVHERLNGKVFRRKFLNFRRFLSKTCGLFYRSFTVLNHRNS